MTRFPIQRLLTWVLVLTPSMAFAGGVCILHPQPFKLQSDTINWSIKVKPGSECIQGLRWSTIMIENIKIVDAPKSGRIMIEGPAFRYFASADMKGDRLLHDRNLGNVAAR